MNIFTKINGFVLALIGICHASPALAQGQDTNFKWVGNEISAVVNNSDADMNTVYLYNVGTGKYLNIGSYWGTSVSAYNVGMPITITKNGSNYRMKGPLKTPQGENLAFGRRMDTNDKNSVSWNRVYCDRGIEIIDGHVNGILDWTFTKVGSENTYTIHCNNDETGYNMHGKRYLHVSTSASSSNRLELDYPTSVTDNNGRWKIVTLKDLKDAFKEQYASEEDPADATFLIKNQNFSRSSKEIEKWEKTGFTSKYTNSEYFLFDPATSYTYYVGMGCQKSDGYQTEYGRYWIGSVRNLGNNANANGTLIQKVTVLKAGWYKVSCDGFYATNSSTSNMKSELVAYVTGHTTGTSSTSVTLNKFKKEFTYTKDDLTHVYTADNLASSSSPRVSPYIKAAKLFEEAKYNNSVMVYVPNDGNELNIGIKISGSYNELDWTAFDNFQLKYCGKHDLVLDENQQSVDYMTQQKDETHAATLILKRSIKADKWNSITLPVNLTVGQFKTAFGNQAKLSVLQGTDPNRRTRIVFKSVDLTNDAAVAITAGKLYIMKPVQEANVTNGSYEKILKDNSKITVNAPYFVINNVTLKTVPEPIIKEEALVSHNPDVKIQFCGVMINHTGNVVPKYSYVLGGTDGKWYYTQSDLPIKGFRTYIATGGAAGAQALTFAIDDEDFGDITGINGIGTDEETNSNATVYNLNGQVVRSGSSSLEGLPKGIYIINHKKVIVK